MTANFEETATNSNPKSKRHLYLKKYLLMERSFFIGDANVGVLAVNCKIIVRKIIRRKLFGC